MANGRTTSGTRVWRRGRRAGAIENQVPPSGRRLFGSAARARGFLIGNVLWFGGILAVLIALPDDQTDGGASPARILVLAPVVLGFVLIERGVMAMSRSSGGTAWNVSFGTRLRVMSPKTFRSAAEESGLPAPAVVVGICLLAALAAVALLRRSA